MNKFEKAYSELWSVLHNEPPEEIEKNYQENIKLLESLKSLVDRAIPMKPFKKYYTSRYGNNGTKKRVDIKCPHCKSAFINGVRSSIGVFQSKEFEFIETINNQKFCRFCSQAIDWSE